MSTEQKKKFSKEEIQAALEILHSEYFMQTVGLLSHTDQQELSYVKVPVVTPEGGTYLISILHVDGPKLDLQKLAKVAEAVESEEKKNG